MKAQRTIWYSEPDDFTVSVVDGKTVVTKGPKSFDKRVQTCRVGKNVPENMLKHEHVKKRLVEQRAITNDPEAIDPRKVQLANEVKETALKNPAAIEAAKNENIRNQTKVAGK